jgi:hypothetical protein
LKKALSKLSIDGLSVDERLRNFFESYAGVGPEQAAALDDLVDLSGEAKSQHVDGERWTREELHERS